MNTSVGDISSATRNSSRTSFGPSPRYLKYSIFNFHFSLFCNCDFTASVRAGGRQTTATRRKSERRDREAQHRVYRLDSSDKTAAEQITNHNGREKHSSRLSSFLHAHDGTSTSRKYHPPGWAYKIRLSMQYATVQRFRTRENTNTK